MTTKWPLGHHLNPCRTIAEAIGVCGDPERVRELTNTHPHRELHVYVDPLKKDTPTEPAEPIVRYSTSKSLAPWQDSPGSEISS